ncbi:MAG: hypothetical protein WC563_15725 [Brevundimonas sp.]
MGSTQYGHTYVFIDGCLLAEETRAEWQCPPPASKDDKPIVADIWCVVPNAGPETDFFALKETAQEIELVLAIGKATRLCAKGKIESVKGGGACQDVASFCAHFVGQVTSHVTDKIAAQLANLS